MGVNNKEEDQNLLEVITYRCHKINKIQIPPLRFWVTSNNNNNNNSNQILTNCNSKIKNVADFCNIIQDQNLHFKAKEIAFEL